ncbi:MAG: ABC transporter ATP-binding protein [Actinomycetota bacterium]
MLRGLLPRYRSEFKRITFLTVLGTFGALAEVAALLALAPLLQAAAEGSTRYQGDAGPISIDISIRNLALISGAMVAAALVINVILTYYGARIVANASYRKRMELIGTYQSASWEAQSEQPQARLAALFNAHCQRYGVGLRLISTLTNAAVTVAVFVVGSMVVSLVATIAIIVSMGVIALAMRPIPIATRRVEERLSTVQIELHEDVVALGGAAREINAFGAAVGAAKQARRHADDERGLRARTGFLTGLTAPLYRSAGLLLLIGLIVFVVEGGQLEVAAIGIIVLFLYRSLGRGQALVNSYQRLAAVPPFVEELQRSIDRLRSNPRPDGPVTRNSVTEIAVDDVTFTYPGEAVPALTEVSLRIGHGEVIGVVGPSGAGKSTLAELLLALREPDTGRILFDGIDVRELSADSRCQLTAIVSQSVPIVPGTLRDNVRFYRSIEDEVVDHALQRVGLTSTVAALPDGGDTMLGPGQRSLSGGQVQRVGVARALVGSPSLVVLDEPTSALDAYAESTITDLIGELRHQAATVVIAHRFSTLRHCDRVLVIVEGRVLDEGPLDDLRQRVDYVEHALAAGTM